MPDFPSEWPAIERKPLEGRYCVLRPMEPAQHASGLFVATMGDAAERLYRWLPEEAPASLSALSAWMTEKSALVDPLFFAVIDKTTNRTEGRQALMRIDRKNGVCEIGNILWGPRIAGTRIATEALYLFANYIFSLGYRRFEWKCNALNEPSRNAALRFGFSFEGIFRQHMVIKGENRDTAWFAMLDHEWPTLKAGYEAWLDPENFDGFAQQKRKLSECRAAA
jgi:RimJ/RimL family protein N-acetyltransferase